MTSKQLLNVMAEPGGSRSPAVITVTIVSRIDAYSVAAQDLHGLGLS